MKSCRWIVLFAIVICCNAQENSSPKLHAFTVIRAGTLIDGKSDTPRHNQVIILRGNRIESISDAATANWLFSGHGLAAAGVPAAHPRSRPAAGPADPAC